MPQELSTLRLWLMRLPFLLAAIRLGPPVWSELLQRGETWDALQGIAYSFWAALGVFALIGLRFPERMLPLLLLQFGYKLIWLLAVAYPLWAANALDDPTERQLVLANGVGVALDLIAIPWLHAYRRYLRDTFRLVPRPCPVTVPDSGRR